MRSAVHRPDRRRDRAVARRPLREGSDLPHGGDAHQPPGESVTPHQSLNYLSHILAKVEGIAAGVDEVIMLDNSGYVAEASGMNVFAVTNGTLKTPPAYAGILRGVTRDAVIELAREATYGIEEVPLNRYDLYTA